MLLWGQPKGQHLAEALVRPRRAPHLFVHSFFHMGPEEATKQKEKLAMLQTCPRPLGCPRKELRVPYWLGLIPDLQGLPSEEGASRDSVAFTVAKLARTFAGLL